MHDEAELRRILTRMDGKGYASYKQLKGNYRLGAFVKNQLSEKQI